MKNKKKLKGFTLIELIIVLAIFGLILTVVMSLIDPVSKVMKKASTRERTAAYADNICEYITNSLSYAKYMHVYDADFFTDESGTDEPMSETMKENEMKAAEILVADVLDDAVGENYVPVSGQVRVLKFINSPDINGDGIDDYEEGQIYESVYEFTAGHKEVFNSLGVKILEEEKPTIEDLDNSIVDRAVVNPEHLEEYCYYYKKGFFTLDPIADPDNYSDGSDEDRSFEAVPIDYYSSLMPIRNASSPDYTLNINVISYQRDDNGALSNKLTDITYTKDEDTTENVMLFRSPAHLNSASMALINIQKIVGGDNVTFKTPKRDDDGVNIGYLDPPSNPNAYDEFELDDPDAYTGSVKDNIYVVYIMPNEMNDVQVVLNSNSNAPDVP